MLSAPPLLSPAKRRHPFRSGRSSLDGRAQISGAGITRLD